MKTHHLKTWPEYFQRVRDGQKTFEVRKADRDYQVKDILRLMEYSPQTNDYTGRISYRQVSYILQGGSFGIEQGYCVMGFEHVWPAEDEDL